MISGKPGNDAAREMLEDYVELCNRALSESMDRFWYRQAERLNRMIRDDAHVHTVVYDEHPDEVVGEFTLHYDPDALELSVLPSGAHDVAFTWKVPLDYLDDVVNERPEWYLEHPVRLDGVWAAERVRDEVQGRTDAFAGFAAGLALGMAAGAAAVYLVRRDGGA